MSDTASNTARKASSKAAGKANQAKDNPATQWLGRLGLASYGVVHVVICYLAVRIAVGGGGGQSADQKGAVSEIAGTGFGKVVLWVLALGLLAYGVWQLLMAATSYTWVEAGRKRITKKVGAAARGVVVLALGAYAVKTAVGSGGGQSSNDQQKEMTAKLMSLPAGRVLVGVVALAVIGVGIAGIANGVRKEFMKDLNTGELPSGTQQWVRRSGMVGYIAKGVAIGVVGILLGTAALDSNAGKAGGLDAALRTLGQQPFGVVILIAVAAGFAAFGVYCFGAARCHRS